MGYAIALKKYESDHDTGVIAYMILRDGIILKFKSKREFYLYNNKKPGAAHIKQMQACAIKGSGLSTYINQHIRENYFRNSTDINDLTNGLNS